MVCTTKTNAYPTVRLVLMNFKIKPNSMFLYALLVRKYVNHVSIKRFASLAAGTIPSYIMGIVNRLVLMGTMARLLQGSALHV